MVVAINKELKANKAIKEIMRTESEYYQSLLDMQRELDDYMYEITEKDSEDEKRLDNYQGCLNADDQWVTQGREIRIVATSKIGLENLGIYENTVKSNNVVLFRPCSFDELPLVVKNLINKPLEVK